MAALERTHFWGCTLTKDKPVVKWQGTEGNDDNEVDILNQLALSQACLGPKAKAGTTHVVQVTTKGIKNDSITQPIIILGGGVEQVQCRLEFNTSATFKLIEGPGPVYLAGSHVQVLSGGYEESEDESEDEGISTAKESSVNGTAKTTPSPSKQPPIKKAKLELENDIPDKEEDSSDEEEDEDTDDEEPVKPDPKKVGQGKEAPAGNKKTPQKDTPPAKKGISTFMEKEAEERSEDSEEMDESEEEEDDENDEDFQGEESEDDDDEDDDEDDEDDEDEEDEEDSEESGGSDNDITNAITTKSKLRNQKNENKEPDRSATPAKKGPGKNATAEKKTPKKGNVDASVAVQKTPDIATVKQKLLKSPNLPKKIDKFKNFMKTNMKITDDKTVKEVWTWLQKNKK